MKLIFAGTPDFAVPSLQTLIEAGHEICAVYTQPDRPAGRGRRLLASPVKQLAQQHNLPVLQPLSLKTASQQQTLIALQADLMVVVAYGLLLPEVILQAPRLGCINVHASLLPRWRGAAPIQRALLAGDTQTGITLMQMTQGLDTGPMLAQAVCEISATTTTKSLHDQLKYLGAELLRTNLIAIEEGSLVAQAQEETQACYAPKLVKTEAAINWQFSAIELDRLVRAFNPWPVAYTTLADKRLRILQAEIVNDEDLQAHPGAIVAVDKAGIDVACGIGVLRLQRLQLPGGKVLPVQDILNAHGNLFTVGHVFEFVGT